MLENVGRADTRRSAAHEDDHGRVCSARRRTTTGCSSTSPSIPRGATHSSVHSTRHRKPMRTAREAVPTNAKRRAPAVEPRRKELDRPGPVYVPLCRICPTDGSSQASADQNHRERRPSVHPLTPDGKRIPSRARAACTVVRRWCRRGSPTRAPLLALAAESATSTARLQGAEAGSFVAPAPLLAGHARGLDVGGESPERADGRAGPSRCARTGPSRRTGTRSPT